MRTRIKLWAGGIDQSYYDFIVGKYSINNAEKSLPRNQKMTSVIILKLSIPFIKSQWKKVKMQVITWEEIFSTHITNEALVLRKALLQINTKMRTNQVEKKTAKGMNLYFTEEKT